MKLLFKIIPMVVLVLLYSCKKNKDKAPTPAPTSFDSTINLGETEVRTLNPNEVLWMELDVEAGKIYKLAWYDSWFSPYTANSIYVTGYKTNKIDTYFPWQRLIQMNGAPKSFIASDNGKIYLKIQGYDASTSGSFAVEADTLNRNAAINITLGGPHSNYSVPIGGVLLYKFIAVADSSYSVSMLASPYKGAYGNENEITFNCMGGVNYANYFFEESPGVILFTGGPKIRDITAETSGPIYVAINGAYWFIPRTGSLWVD